MVIIIFCNFACSQECVAHSRTFTGQTCWLWLGQETPTWVDRGRTQTSWYQRICFPWGKNWYFPLCRNVHGANFFSHLFVHFGVVFLEKAIRGFQKFCMEADDRQSKNIYKIRKNISNRNVFWKPLQILSLISFHSFEHRHMDIFRCFFVCVLFLFNKVVVVVVVVVGNDMKWTFLYDYSRSLNLVMFVGISLRVCSNPALLLCLYATLPFCDNSKRNGK